MQFFVPKETDERERRVALVPETVARLAKLGASVQVESGIGTAIRLSDDAYREAGATVREDRGAALGEADVVVRLSPPDLEEVAGYKRGALYIGYMDPFIRHDLVRAFAAAGVTALSVEMIPRSTIAQKMDALSSQASLAGYVAVMLAAVRLPKILPMMMTPAGTIAPARVFVVGAGVAGLQAIATAKRLGARVEAFDTRPVVKEQVESLGARFLEIDLGETGQSKDGYAKALTEEQLKKQREGMAAICARSDIVITTAQVFGRKAPVIITRDMVEGMQPGSVVIDLAVETGGNVEGSRPGEDVDIGGVLVVGPVNIPGFVATDASSMYSGNLGNFIEHFWDREAKTLTLDPEDEIVRGCTVTRDGEIVHTGIRDALG